MQNLLLCNREKKGVLNEKTMKKAQKERRMECNVDRCALYNNKTI